MLVFGQLFRLVPDLFSIEHRPKLRILILYRALRSCVYLRLDYIGQRPALFLEQASLFSRTPSPGCTGATDMVMCLREMDLSSMNKPPPAANLSIYQTEMGLVSCYVCRPFFGLVRPNRYFFPGRSHILFSESQKKVSGSA